MKQNLGKRILSFLHWIFSALAFIALLFFVFWPKTVENGATVLHGAIGAVGSTAVGIVLLVIYGLLLVGMGFTIFSRKDKKNERGFIIVDNSESGKTRIAVGAVEQMIRQAVRNVDGIAELKSSISNNADDISVNCSVVVVNGAHVPTVTMNIQRAIRSYIELNCGVAVREVSVSVNSLDTGEPKGRWKGGKAAAAAAVPAAIEAVPVAQEAPAAQEDAAAEAPAAEEPASLFEDNASTEEVQQETAQDEITLTLEPDVQWDAPEEKAAESEE